MMMMMVAVLMMMTDADVDDDDGSHDVVANGVHDHLHSYDSHQLVRHCDDDEFAVHGDDGADDGVDRDGIDNGAHVQLQTLAPILR